MNGRHEHWESTSPNSAEESSLRSSSASSASSSSGKMHQNETMDTNNDTADETIMMQGRQTRQRRSLRGRCDDLLGWKNNAWEYYKEWLVKNQSTVSLADETINQLLFWCVPSAPHNNNIHDNNGDGGEKHPALLGKWREILWAVLQLHRIVMDVALEEEDEVSRPGNLCGGRLLGSTNTNDYGTSIAIENTTTDLVPAKTIRIGLTVLQTLWPVLQELVVVAQGQHDGNETSASTAANNENARICCLTNRRRQASVRLWMERIRFLLRTALLGGYWRRMVARERLVPGLLLRGGLYQSTIHHHHRDGANAVSSAPNVSQELARRERQAYAGRRTGRRVVVRRTPGASHLPRRQPEQRDDDDVDCCCNGNAHYNIHSQRKQRRVLVDSLAIVFAELLYLARPLIFAQAECNHHHHTNSEASASEATAAALSSLTATAAPSPFRTSSSSPRKLLWKAWTLCLGMDATSLLLIRQHQSRAGAEGAAAIMDNNHATAAEWERRKMRLLLYLLRAPAWDRYCEPGLDRVTSVLDRFVPLLGRLGTGYFWEWIYYWKLHRAEEG